LKILLQICDNPERSQKYSEKMAFFSQKSLFSLKFCETEKNFFDFSSLNVNYDFTSLNVNLDFTSLIGKNFIMTEPGVYC
jgi:hypothetical protein